MVDVAYFNRGTSIATAKKPVHPPQRIDYSSSGRRPHSRAQEEKPPFEPTQYRTLDQFMAAWRFYAKGLNKDQGTIFAHAYGIFSARLDQQEQARKTLLHDDPSLVDEHGKERVCDIAYRICEAQFPNPHGPITAPEFSLLLQVIGIKPAQVTWDFSPEGKKLLGLTARSNEACIVLRYTDNDTLCYTAWKPTPEGHSPPAQITPSQPASQQDSPYDSHQKEYAKWRQQSSEEVSTLEKLAEEYQLPTRPLSRLYSLVSQRHAPEGTYHKTRFDGRAAAYVLNAVLPSYNGAHSFLLKEAHRLLGPFEEKENPDATEGKLYYQFTLVQGYLKQLESAAKNPTLLRKPGNHAHFWWLVSGTNDLFSEIAGKLQEIEREDSPPSRTRSKKRETK